MIAKPSKVVYLAGPIAGLTYDEAQEWRKAATDYLNLLDVTVLNPLRVVQPFNGVHGNQGVEEAHFSARGMIMRDRTDVYTSDLILMNLSNAKGVSIGSCVELGWADAYRKPVVTISTDPKPHAFIYELSSYVVPNLHEALIIVKGILAL